jgi:hypothetical protein
MFIENYYEEYAVSRVGVYSIISLPAWGFVINTGRKPRGIKADKGWFLSIYGGQVNEDSLENTLTLNANYVNSYFCAFTAGKKLANYRGNIDIEAGGQIVKHWGIQDHFEFNALIILRWLPFPWDEYLDTSFAVGDGISYATKYPEIEVGKKHPVSQKILNYLMFELAFVVPKKPNWSVFIRLHHRSAMFGLIGGEDGGSNAAGIGFRYTF